MATCDSLLKELDQVEASQPPDELRTVTLRPLRHAFALSLLYSHDDYDTIKPLIEAAPDIYEQIRAAFDEHLYVHRHVVDEIVGLASHRRLVILTGHAGSGKSTVLRRLHSVLPSNETASVTYINLKDEFDSLPTSVNPENTVCGIVYDKLMETVLVNRPEWKRRLRASNVLHNKYFRMLRRQIFADPDFTIAQDGDRVRAVAEALSRPVYRRRYQRLEDGWLDHTDESDQTSRLRALLLSLQYEGHHPLLLIDNIDRYKLDLQAMVIDKAMDFATPPLLTAIVAVRTGNFRRLIAESHGDYIHYVHHLRDERYSKQLPGEGTLRQFVSRRLKFAFSLVHEYADSPKILQAAKLRNFSSASELLEAHLDALRHLSQDVVHVDVVRAFIQWHNDSLRGAAARLFNLVHSMLMGRDPLYLFRDLLNRGKARTPQTKSVDERRLRTMLYRHMILSNRRPTEELMVLNVLRKLPSDDAEPMLAFPHDKILWLLLNCPNHETSYGSIISKLAGFNLDKEACFATLKELWHPRPPYDPSGFIMIDRAEDRVVCNMDTDTTVQLLPAGRLFLLELSVSCEYAFWMALHSDSWKPPRAISVKGVDSDVFRSFIATQFARDELLPKALQELESQSAEGRTRELSLMFGYGRRNWGLFVERLARSLNGFVREAQLHLATLTSEDDRKLKAKRQEYLNRSTENINYIFAVCSEAKARVGISGPARHRS